MIENLASEDLKEIQGLKIEENLMAEIDQEDQVLNCIRQFVINAEKNAKCHSSQQVENQSIAEAALSKIRPGLATDLANMNPDQKQMTG